MRALALLSVTVTTGFATSGCALDSWSYGAPFDGGNLDARASAVCRIDSECDDGLFCTGVERCALDAGLGGTSRCVAGTVPCAAACDESADRCGAPCDADSDTHDSTACGGDDCDDARAEAHPGAVEICNARDDDCSDDGGADASEDTDGDTHSLPSATCTGGYPRDDCDDTDPASYPGALGLAPAPHAPMNGSYTGSHRAAARGTLRPTFRWRAPSSTCLDSYELEVDDSCTTPGFATCGFPSPEIRVAGLTTTSHTPSADLPVSTVAPVGRRYYWHVRSCINAACSPWSPVRYVDVGRPFGDLNGDGFSDLVAGAPGAGTATERVFVYFGGPTGIPSTSSASVTLDNPSAGANHGFGEFIAAAGDLNADGFADLVVSARYAASGDGLIFVLLGRAGTAWATMPSVTVSSPTGEDGSEFGSWVAGAGDLDADGFGDLVVGAFYHDGVGAPGVGVESGSAFLFRGGADGVSSSRWIRLDNPSAQPDGQFGDCVAAAGDTNGDGHGDLVVGAWTEDAPEVDEGNVLVYLGGSDTVLAERRSTLDNPGDVAAGRFGAWVSSISDVDGDGLSDIAVSAWAQGPSLGGQVFVYRGVLDAGVGATPAYTLATPDAEAGGRFAVLGSAPAGDVNGDRLGDLCVGAPYQDGDTSGGNAYVFFGAATGILPRAQIGNDAHESIGDEFGYSVACAGDFNGDGLADLVVGAPAEDFPSTSPGLNAGRVYLYYGRAGTGTGLNLSAELASPGGLAAAGFGTAVAP